MSLSLHEFSRRDLLKISLGSALGVSCSGWLPKIAQAAAGKENKPKACIVLWMSGGPTQTDTFDLKPEHENGGPFKQIETTVPGIEISEHLPGLARGGHLNEYGSKNLFGYFYCHSGWQVVGYYRSHSGKYRRVTRPNICGKWRRG